jgi:hypothetical protein
VGFSFYTVRGAEGAFLVLECLSVTGATIESASTVGNFAGSASTLSRKFKVEIDLCGSETKSQRAKNSLDRWPPTCVIDVPPSATTADQIFVIDVAPAFAMCTK